ncbi:MAG: host-nuclease inhibitor Gam family protein [Verrucomicrobiota bacterium]
MSKREKIVPCIITSREGLESTVADVVRLKLEHVKRQAAMEAEIAEVQKRHQEGLLSVAKQIEIKEAGIYVFCQQHRKTLFPEKKSIDLLLAVVGFRDNPPSVGKLANKDTWPVIATRLASLDWGQKYVTYADPEVNKKQILLDRSELTPEQLKAAGIKIDQDENFYIEPKSEVADASVREAA